MCSLGPAYIPDEWPLRNTKQTVTCTPANIGIKLRYKIISLAFLIVALARSATDFLSCPDGNGAQSLPSRRPLRGSLDSLTGRAMALVEIRARKILRAPQGRGRSATNLDGELCAHAGAQRQEPQLHSWTQSVLRHGR